MRKKCRHSTDFRSHSSEVTCVSGPPANVSPVLTLWLTGLEIISQVKAGMVMSHQYLQRERESRWSFTTLSWGQSPKMEEKSGSGSKVKSTVYHVALKWNLLLHRAFYHWSIGFRTGFWIHNQGSRMSWKTWKIWRFLVMKNIWKIRSNILEKPGNLSIRGLILVHILSFESLM